MRAPRDRLARWAIGLAIAAALIALDVHLARRVASSPARCAEGMVLAGARCCGEGQRVDAGRCVGPATACARGLTPTADGCVPPSPAPRVRVTAGTLTVAPGDWEASGVVRWHRQDVAAFELDAHEVTEARWSRCVDAGACPALPLRGEPGLPVTGATAVEASGLCAHEGGRLPTEGELAFAAAGPGGRRYPWGATGFVCRRAAWGLVRGPCAEGAVGPEIVGAHPAGATPDGIHDLAGNVAEWTERTDQASGGGPPGAPASKPPPVSGPPPASGQDGERAVLGGAFDDVEAAALRTWSRRRAGAGERRASIGFRCAYDTPGTKGP